MVNIYTLKVSIHSRLKAAATEALKTRVGNTVSIHSRLKAADRRFLPVKSPLKFQYTAA